MNVNLGNLNSGNIIRNLTDTNIVMGLAILFNGYLASSSDRIIRAWDLDTGSIVKNLTDHSGYGKT